MGVRWREWAGIYGADIGGNECQIHPEGKGWQWMVITRADGDLPEHQGYADDLDGAKRACEATARAVAEAEDLQDLSEGRRPWRCVSDEDG